MSNLFAWLDNLATLVFSFFPHLFIVNANQRGIKFSRGKHVRELPPGLHWYWPLVTEEPVAVPVMRQTLSLAAIKVTTKDGSTLAMTFTMVYHVVDVVKAAVRTHDLDDALSDVTSATILPLLLSMTWEEIRTQINEGILQSKVLLAAQAYMVPFGLQVTEMIARDVVKTCTLSLIGDGFLTSSSGD